MGAWGTGLYSSDLATDVRNDYCEMLVFHYSHEKAVKRLVQEYELLEDDPYNAAGWFALADSAWKYGHLDDELKRRVQRLYDEEAEKKLWADSPEDFKKRKAVIARLLEKIQTPREKAAKPSLRFVPYNVDWHVGDLIAFQLQNGPYCGNYIAVLIVSRREIPISRFASPTDVSLLYTCVLSTYNQKHIPKMTDFQETIGIYYDTKRRERVKWSQGKIKKEDPEDGDCEARFHLDTREMNKKIERLFTVIGKIDATTLQRIRNDTQISFLGSAPLYWGMSLLPLIEQNDVLIYRRDG